MSYSKSSVADPYTFFMDPDPDPGKKHIFSKAIQKMFGKIVFSTKKVGRVGTYFIKLGICLPMVSFLKIRGKSLKICF